jgi:peptidyl-dipeptidase Dcp
MRIILLAALLLTTTVNAQTVALNKPVKNNMTTVAEANILEEKWQGAYGGFPPFEKVQVSQFKPALEDGMTENLKEIDDIVNQKEAPNFENTIIALEKSGKKLERVSTIYDIWSSTMSSKEFQEVESTMAPKLSEFNDKITQNAALFSRIESVYNSPEKAKLTPEQQRLVWNYYTNFVSAGAKAKPESKPRLAEINKQLAELTTKFSQNLLADEGERYLVLEKEDDLAGLPATLRSAYAASAVSRKIQNAWVINNTRSSVDPFLTYSTRRDLREKVWKMFTMRGDNGDEHDNNEIVKKILVLRQERARLLGFNTHADWRLQNSMAKTPQHAMDLMNRVWPAAIKRVSEEVKDMQAIADKEGAKITIEPWDYKHYSEKVRLAKYDLDQNEVKEYLQLEKLREGMFWVAGELFNFTFTPVTDVPVYHPDVRVWEVKDKTTGKHIGLWYFDAYAREGKHSGAWMNAYRNQQTMQGVSTIVSNNANFVKGKPGEPVLISWDDAETLFHEFGHALHGLASNVTYPSLSGTNVFRDYVEFPSQLLEHWLATPEVLNKFAVHYKTGQPIPQILVDKIKKASTFNEGFATTEYLASALIDMKLHMTDAATIDPKKFEKEELAKLGMPKEIVMRHRIPQFAHIFSGDGYSAGYYSYLWADVLTADAFQAFVEGKGPYDMNVAERLKKNVFSVGNTIDPEVGYRNFRGRDANPDALMRKRGFIE